MAILDPHAIPEDEHACEEYLHEANAAWDANNQDHAYDLYYALFESAHASAAAKSHAAHRVGLIAHERGDTDVAVHFLSSSSEAGAADALHAITGATHDPTPDPNVIPQTAEQLFAWAEAARAAGNAGQWDLCRNLYTAASQATSISGDELGDCYYNMGIASEHLGDLESAVRYYELAIPLFGAKSEADDARRMLHRLGGGAVGATGSTPAEAQVADGINAYENGDATTARTTLEAAMHLEGPDDQKARAQYYLGVLDYQSGHYAVARDRVEAAIAAAPEPEKSWAQAMLGWRWDEHPAAAPNQPAAPAGP